MGTACFYCVSRNSSVHWNGDVALTKFCHWLRTSGVVKVSRKIPFRGFPFQCIVKSARMGIWHACQSESDVRTLLKPNLTAARFDEILVFSPCSHFKFYCTELSKFVENFHGNSLFHGIFVPYICVSESGQHCFRLWLVGYSVQDHDLNQCWDIVNWALRNKLQWNFKQNTKLFIHENASEHIVCEMVAILCRVDELME